MKFNKKKASIAVGAAAAVTMLIAPPALALTTLEVAGSTASPVVAVAVVGSLKGSVSFLTDFDVPATCSTASATGYVLRGAELLNGVKIGGISNLTFGACSATDLNLPVSVALSAKVGAPAEWPIYWAGSPTKGSASAAIVIRNVTAKMHSTGSPTWICDLEAQGDVAARLYQGAIPEIRITPTPGVFPLAIRAFNGSGMNVPAATTCAGQIYTGDNAQMTGTFTLNTSVRW